MKALQIKDQKLKKKFFKYELKKKINKFLFIYCLIKKINYKQILKLNFLNFNYSKVKLTNRCIFNNRSKGVIRKYSISRIYMRNLLQLGIIPGFTKSVW